ncbi:MAG: hypothetical protein GEU73_07510 [Chloroflexi bacterium]|nr:hypothetical protein [Chloroflexota bacterium]
MARAAASTFVDARGAGGEGLEAVGVLAAFVLVLVAAWGIPRVLISDGLEQFEGEERAAAEWALGFAWRHCVQDEGASSEWDAAVVQRLQMVDFELLPPDPEVSPFQRARRHGLLRSHAFFGLPIGTISIEPGGGCKPSYRLPGPQPRHIDRCC